MTQITVVRAIPDLERLPRVYFYTSNLPKYLQARLVFASFGFRLEHFRSYSEPYDDNYGSGTERLLEDAIRHVVQTVGDRYLLFIEDTSIRIDALSTPDRDFPGLAAKEWFASTSFESLDRQLRQIGMGRSATVKSDIALHLPGLLTPVFFHGETTGSVAEGPPQFDQRSPSHPWLTPATFNGWFVPAGARKRLGEMSMEESWTFDFRIRSFTALIKRLQEYALVLNLPSYACTPRAERTSASQLTLFAHVQRIFVVIGRPSAGKSEFGRYMSNEWQIPHVEASDAVRAAREASIDRGATIELFGAAFHRLYGQDVVVRTLLETTDLAGLESGFVITGLRHVEELEYLRSRYENVSLIYVDATDRTRFERHLRRGRVGDASEFVEFQAREAAQMEFSLTRLGRQIADFVIVNEGSLADYTAQIDFVTGMGGRPRPRGIRRVKHDAAWLHGRRSYWCLKALEEAGRPLSAKEVTAIVEGRSGKAISSGVGRLLRSLHPLIQEIMSNELRGFVINPTGSSFLRVMESQPSV